MKRITLLYALAATLMVCSGCSDFWKNTIVVRLLPKVVIMILRKVLSL